MPGISSFVRKNKNGVTFAAILLLCLLLMLFSNRNVVLQPKKVGQTFFSVFQLSVHAVSDWFTETVTSIRELQRLRNELEEARERLMEYERVSRDLAELRRENQELRAQLGFSETLPFRYISAQVIARDPGNQFSTIAVNRGSIHGMQEGMPVIAFQGGLQGLVGRVVLVSLVSSMVQPITDPASYVAARLQSSRFDGLIAGSQGGGAMLTMSYVKKLAVKEVQYGELVITSGMGQLFPEGIHIGRVREMTAKGYEASLELEIEPIVDFSRLEFVYIIDAEQK
ncbi:MAG: rod shape-determining protein MreC [Spirochaetaceae bacterium]|nr:MAG: rod shape-determining protein MreC [Spirochaetaceae bacterium]